MELRNETANLQHSLPVGGERVGYAQMFDKGLTLSISAPYKSFSHRNNSPRPGMTGLRVATKLEHKRLACVVVNRKQPGRLFSCHSPHNRLTPHASRATASSPVAPVSPAIALGFPRSLSLSPRRLFRAGDPFLQSLIEDRSPRQYRVPLLDSR